MGSTLPASILGLVLAAAVAGQQPNSTAHTMRLNGADGPPFPILTNVETNTTVVLAFIGAPNQPYAVFQGALQPGAAIALNGIVDLALSPVPALVVDGFQNTAFQTDATGNGFFTVQVPNVGYYPNGIPIGTQVAVQAVIGDPINNPFGLSLTAATLATVTQGPVVTYYSLGGESMVLVTPGLTIPFYGVNHQQIHLGSNGYLTFAIYDQSDFTPSPIDMYFGPPRIAPFWCDLVCQPSQVRTIVDTNPGPGLPSWIKIEYTNVQDQVVGPGLPHTFSTLLRSDGYLELSFAVATAPSVHDQITGITPGSNVTTLPQKNFAGAQPPGSTVGPGILTTAPFSYIGAVNESFYEWFGAQSQNVNYWNPYDNSFDLFGATLHFAPVGSGTSQYVVY